MWNLLRKVLSLYLPSLHCLKTKVGLFEMPPILAFFTWANAGVLLGVCTVCVHVSGGGEGLGVTTDQIKLH